MVNIIFRHISGSRATQVDVVAVGAHRELILGRAPSAAVRFDLHRDTTVGRHHARIEPDATDATQLRLLDLGSRNGTYLNGARIVGPTAIHAGDILRLGEQGPEVQVLIESTPAALVI